MLKLYEYIWHAIISKIPLFYIRNLYLKVGNNSINNDVCILPNVRFKGIRNVTFNGKVIVNQHVTLDGRGGLVIGNNVDIAERAVVWSMSHDPNSEQHVSITKETQIGDYVWVGSSSIILPGISLGEGCIVGAGAVVTKNVNPYDIVAGNPAKVIGKRNGNQKYQLQRRDIF